MPPDAGCPTTGLPSSEVTGAICLVPSTPFAQTPWYTLPVHLCRFRVRSIRGGSFPEEPCPPPQSDKRRQTQLFVTTRRPGNINPVPIDYAFRPRLRGRLTLRGLTLRRNPWTFGGSVSHTPLRYSCQHSHFRYLQAASRTPFAGLRNAPLPLRRQISDVRCQKFGDAGPGAFWRSLDTRRASAARWLPRYSPGPGNIGSTPAFRPPNQWP